MNEKSLTAALQGLPIPQTFYFDSIDSTNEKALVLLASGAEEYTTLVADKQTSGRGRMGRKWVTVPGSSLAFTIILHPLEEEQQRMGFFSFLGGLAVCLAIEEFCKIKPQLKWPNDVLLDNKKTAGILAESFFQGGKLAGVALGIGINLERDSIPPADELMFPATCIADHCGELSTREDFLSIVISQLIRWRARILKPEFFQAYQSRLAYVGDEILLIQHIENTIEGRLLGVNNSGYLVLELNDGEIKAFPVGDVKLRIK